MKTYPSISTSVDFSLTYCIFDKLDGSNLRAEWTPKRGFYKFGSRTQLLTPDQAPLWPAQERLVALEKRLRPSLEKLRTERAVCFFEWAGPNSFAGSHPDALDQMDLFLLDVDVFKKGRLAPETTLALANESGVSAPALLHRGKIDAEFLQAVRLGQLPGVTFEGIIGKSVNCLSQEGGPAMFKHKSQAWLDKLRQFCGDDDALFHRLR